MSKKSIQRLLLVEDNPVDARLLREMFNKQGSHDTELTHVECMSEAEKHLAERAADIILLDLGLPDAQGLGALRRAHAAAPRVPLVVLTSLDDESLAAQALQEGAQGYLIKGPIDARGLLRALRHAIERKIMEEALFVEKDRAQVTPNCIGDAVICTNFSDNITFLQYGIAMALILVVDDNVQSRQLYVSLLTPFGHQVVEAGDGIEGLEQARLRKPDLIISDILMPTMNGYEFVSALRKSPSLENVPVVFNSATFLDRETRSLGAACGVSLFISKPCEPERALAIIQEALGLEIQMPAAPAPIQTGGDAIPLLIDAFFEKGKQLDAVSVRLASLLELGLDLAHSCGLDGLIDKAGNAARKIIGANYSGIGILAGNGPHLRSFALFGADPEVAAKLAQAVFNGPIFREIVSERKARRAFSPFGEPARLELPAHHPPVRSFLGVPLEAGDRVYGWIYVADKLASLEFTEEDSRILTALAAQAALAFENSLGFLAIQKHAAKLEAEVEERKIMEEVLFVEKERAQVTLNCIGDAVICTDISGNVTFLNVVAEKMTGWSRQEAAGRPMVEVFRILDATSRETTTNPMEIAVGENRTVHLPSNCILIRRDAFEIPIEDCVSPIHDREGQATGAVIVFRDVSAAWAMALQMTHSAQHDFLTGLPNRMLLNDRVSQSIAVAPRHMNQVAVLFLDLDGFKHINDSLGHPIGDKLLQSIAKRLVDCVRRSDTVSRQGGDEFVVLLSEVERSEDAAITARRMLQAVAEAHSIDQHDLHVTTSIGVSVYPDDGLDAETLIKNADTAMYQAKENGRQSYQFFKPAMTVRAVERQSIEESLRRALERQEFALHYQPKINLRTGAITGAEALIRWTHPIRGPVSPAQFIPIAEDCGLILPIGKWVLREACKQARAWVDAGLPPATMAVNISAMEFRDENFLEDVFAILKDTGLDPRSLELELTESVLMKRAESTASVLQTLRARGVHLAVDDFGTGYSSLSYLRKFPIDALKIDQSFVHQITTAPDETTIVTAVISMGRSLKLRVVAEGVETQEELAFLQAHQCDEAQGYHFSRPVLPQQFAKLLETGISETVLH